MFHQVIARLYLFGVTGGSAGGQSDIKHQPQGRARVSREFSTQARPKDRPRQGCRSLRTGWTGIRQAAFAALDQQPRVGSLIEAYHRQRDLTTLSQPPSRSQETRIRVPGPGPKVEYLEQERRVNLTGNGRAEIPLPHDMRNQ